MKQINTIAIFILLVIACTNPSKKQVLEIEKNEKELQKDDNNDNEQINYQTEILDLSLRAMSTLPKSILKYQKLKSINLSDNNFKSFPVELFELPLLEEINFSGGFLSSSQQMFDSLNNDNFLIRLYEKCNGSKMKIICGDYETLYINTNKGREMDINNDFLSLIANYHPTLKCKLSYLEGDAIYLKNTKVNLEIHELNNGVSVRNWNTFYSTGQRFTFDLLDLDMPLEKEILDSKWFLAGEEGDTDMWQNQRRYRSNQQGKKIYSVVRGGC